MDPMGYVCDPLREYQIYFVELGLYASPTLPVTVKIKKDQQKT